MMRKMIVAAACAAAVSVSCASEGAAPEAPRQSRKIEEPEWTETVLLGGTVEDTLLALVGPMVADRRGVFVADPYNGRVIHVDPLGEVVWTAGRKGGGPEEFSHVIDLKVAADGHVWAVDPQNVRISVLDHSGRFVAEVPLSALPTAPAAVLPGKSDMWLLLGTGAAETPLVRVTRNGRIAERRPLPWDSAIAIHPMAGQLTTATDPARGIFYMAYQLGDGIMSFSQGNGRRRPFVEHVPFGRILESRSGNRMTTEFAEQPTFAARAISYSGGELHVHFGGRTDERLSVIDVYGADDLEYRRSYRLPRRVNRAVVTDGVVYADFSDPYPTIMRYTQVEQ